MSFAVGGLAVGHPHIAVPVHEQAVRPVDQAGAEALHHLAGGIEFVDRIKLRTGAELGPATLVDPDAATIAVDIDADRLAPGPTFRKLCPVLDDTISIGCGIGV